MKTQVNYIQPLNDFISKELNQNLSLKEIRIRLANFFIKNGLKSHLKDRAEFISFVTTLI